MGALQKLHQALREGGLLLDVHPEPQPTLFQIWDGTTCHPLDQLVDTSSCIAKIHDSRDHMATMVEQGYFTLEAATTFNFACHFDSIEAWLAYRTERGSTSLVDAAAVATASQLLPEGGELRVLDRVSARLYRRLSR